MHRFFINRESIIADHVKITGNDAEQIRKVLRIREGEEIAVLDGLGWEYKVKLTEIKKGHVTGEIIFKDFKSEDTKIKIILGQGIPKGEKMDFIVQKATELGVNEIVPLKLERCVVKIPPSPPLLKGGKEGGFEKIKRWQRIAKESSEQSLRRFIPSIKFVYNLKEFCDKYENSDLKIVFYEGEKKIGLKDLLTLPLLFPSFDKLRTGSYKGGDEGAVISVIVGPEGGLSSEEVEIANSYGFIPTGLGQRILRTETVALSALSILQFLYGDLGNISE